jgi:hypothetical protein
MIPVARQGRSSILFITKLPHFEEERARQNIDD